MEKVARRVLSGALLMVGAGALLAACSSTNHPSASGTTSTTSHTKNTTTTQATPTTLPVPPTSGPLSVAATVAVPIPANVQITATEAPNGAVFVSQESQDSSVTTSCGCSTPAARPKWPNM